MSGADFFDVDHTITRGSTGRYFFALGVREMLFPLSSVAAFPFTYLRFRWNAGRKARGGRNPNGRADLPGIRGIPKEVLERVSCKSFETRARKEIYPQMLELIGELQRSGRRLVLATSSVDIIVKPLAEFLGIRDVIANTLVFRDGLCTGRFDGVPAFKEGKKRRVMAFIRDHGLSVSDSAFFTDSIHDLPLLEEIGRPHVVNPRPALRRIARQRGWQIHRFS
jgi:HAD superfamily hydrolase (TIGR01490 family)